MQTTRPISQKPSKSRSTSGSDRRGIVSADRDLTPVSVSAKRSPYAPHLPMNHHSTLHTLQLLLPGVRCSFFDQSCNLLRVRNVNRVARARDFNLMAVGSCGIPALEVGIDGSVAAGYQHPAWFALRIYSPALAANVPATAMLGSRSCGRPCRSARCSGLL
jgi:hypothetical protein